MSEYMKEAERLIEDYGNAEWKVGRMSEHSDDAEEIVTRENARAALLAHIRRGVPAPAEVPMPEPDMSVWDTEEVRTYSDECIQQYGAACRAAGKAAGYARGLRDAGRDADRYSFLRGDGGPTSVRWPRWEVAHWTGNWNPVSGKELDAAIDAALRGEVK